MIENNGKFLPGKNDLFKELKKAKKMIPDKLTFLQTTLDNLLKEQKDVGKAYATANISVSPKVKIYIGNQWIAIDDNLGPSTL